MYIMQYRLDGFYPIKMITQTYPDLEKYGYCAPFKWYTVAILKWQCFNHSHDGVHTNYY